MLLWWPNVPLTTSESQAPEVRVLETKAIESIEAKWIKYLNPDFTSEKGGIFLGVNVKSSERPSEDMIL
jgi:hypothetical protein